MITEEKVRPYWEARAARQGRRTVGFVGHELREQDKEYSKKQKLIASTWSLFHGKVLDYGCGIGRHANLCHPDLYLGVDITKSLLDIARSDHPSYKFQLLSELGEIPEYEFDVLFTSTVLQHNADEFVLKLFENLSKARQAFTFVLYENSHPIKASHIVGRLPAEYARLVSAFFEVRTFEEKSHTVHGERHSITIMSAVCR